MTSKALGALMLSGLFFAGPAVAQQGSPPPGGSPSSPAQPGTPGLLRSLLSTMCARNHVHVRGSVPPGFRCDKVTPPRVR
jgi:hypothetical protein